MKVIKSSNFTARFPMSLYLVLWLFMDKYHAPDWIYGVYWTIGAILLATIIAINYERKEVDVIKKLDDLTKERNG